MSLGWSVMGTANEDGAMGTVTGTAECPDSGSMDVEVVGAVDDSMTSGSVEIAFNGCEVDGVIIDGALDYGGRVTETEVTASIRGDLTWSGAATGDCAIDLEARVDKTGASVSGTGAGNAIDGGMCGYAFSDVFAG